jgi:uncharacterized Zn-finger protein
MSDRSVYSHHNVLYPTTQWNNTGPHPSQYSSSTSHYFPASYNAPQSPTHGSAHQVSPYGAANTPSSANMTYQSGHYSTGTPYAPVGNPSSIPQQPVYSVLNQAISPSQSPRQAHPHAHGRSRSHSQSHHPYLSQQPSPHSPPPHSPSQYQQVAFPQSINIPPQYPASPTRPFSCDLCALSFNRQHDLKRHRETHTGEKPFLCNGGCGKTFTRKDALKRHQVRNHVLFCLNTAHSNT